MEIPLGTAEADELKAARTMDDGLMATDIDTELSGRDFLALRVLTRGYRTIQLCIV